MTEHSGSRFGALALRSTLWLVLGGWFGAWMLFAVGVAPAAFRVLPSSEIAGSLISPLLKGLHLYGIAAGLGLSCLSIALRRGLLLSLLPIMPVTVINYGAGLSTMKFNNYIVAHILGITPRAFAYGFFGSTLLEVGSKKFMASLTILVVMGIVTGYFRLRSKKKKQTQRAEEPSVPA